MIRFDWKRALFFGGWIVCCCIPAMEAAGQEVELSLRDAVTVALRNNLQIMLGGDVLMAARGTVESEWGTFDPVLGSEVSRQEKKQPVMTSTGARKEDSTAWSLSLGKKMTTGTELQLSWDNGRLDTDSPFMPFRPYFDSGVSLNLIQPLLKGRGSAVQTAGLRTAEKEAEAARLLVDSQAADLAALVAGAYWDLVLARQDIEVKKLSLRLATDLLEETRQKIEVGVLAPVEVFQPEAEMARREELLIAGERDIAAAEDALKLLMNTGDWAATLLVVDSPEINDAVPGEDAVLAAALQGRQDLRAAAVHVEGAELRAMLARNNLLPGLALTGGVGVVGAADRYAESISDTADDGDVTWSAGLVFSLPLGNRDSRGRYQRAQADLAKARHSAELIRQELTRSVREAVREVRLSLKSVDASRKTALAAKKRLDAEGEKFAVGVSTALDVLDAQEAYAASLVNERRTLVGYAKAVAEVDRVQGLVSIKGE